MTSRLILGIETSCDETAAAVVESGRRLRSNVVASQFHLHAPYGGVVPEVASRHHLEVILQVVDTALAESEASWGDLAAVAVTAGPGLAGALLVGVNTAKTLAWAHGLPLLGVNHLEAHLYANWIEVEGRDYREPELPALGLIVSGGHTDLVLMRDHGVYFRLGRTRDDAAGEAFDKVGRLLGLGFPGGPALARLAESGRPGQFKLPRPMLRSGDLNFSFSGLKTAVLTAVRAGPPAGDMGSNAGSDVDGIGSDPAQFRADLALAVQEAIVDVLVAKAAQAIRQTGRQHLVVAGGVGANRQLRAQLDARGRKGRFTVYYPELEFCTDNGAMIALAGALRLMAGAQPKAAGAFGVRPRWPLAELTVAG